MSCCGKCIPNCRIVIDEQPTEEELKEMAEKLNFKVRDSDTVFQINKPVGVCSNVPPMSMMEATACGDLPESERVGRVTHVLILDDNGPIGDEIVQQIQKAAEQLAVMHVCTVEEAKQMIMNAINAPRYRLDEKQLQEIQLEMMKFQYKDKIPEDGKPSKEEIRQQRDHYRNLQRFHSRKR